MHWSVIGMLWFVVVLLCSVVYIQFCCCYVVFCMISTVVCCMYTVVCCCYTLICCCCFTVLCSRFFTMVCYCYAVVYLIYTVVCPYNVQVCHSHHVYKHFLNVDSRHLFIQQNNIELSYLQLEVTNNSKYFQRTYPEQVCLSFNQVCPFRLLWLKQKWVFKYIDCIYYRCHVQ